MHQAPVGVEIRWLSKVLTVNSTCERGGARWSRDRGIRKAPLRSCGSATVRADDTGVRAENTGVKADDIGVRAADKGVRADDKGVSADDLGINVDEYTRIHGDFVVREVRRVRSLSRASQKYKRKIEFSIDKVV
eukprot:5635478-Pyramimonas_sp.AAC.1